MENKGFAEIKTSVETPNDVGQTEKPLKNRPITSNRVDINVLNQNFKRLKAKNLKKIFIFFHLS